MQCREMPPQFTHHNKGFINYVFCRKCPVRNPAGTRLDSSLVNKQVEYYLQSKVLLAQQSITGKTDYYWYWLGRVL